MLGKLLDGRYQVVQVLGSGGFGQTYIAQDTRRPGNPTCVVKHLKPASSDPNVLQTARRLFNSEAETLEQLGNHDQIPRLLAYFEQDQEFYLVQEFIDGHTLKAELSPGYRWTESQVIQMLQEILSILEFVHSRGVIHRDIKPDNIIRRTSDNKLVLVDFGAVKQLRTQMVGVPELASATVAIGTPGYMPSEQGRGQPRPNSDIYSLGIIAIQALTGLLPLQFQEDPNTGEILWQHIVPVSPGLATVLSKMVRYHFKDRYQSATEALQALRQVNNPQPPVQYATPPSYAPPTMQPPTQPPYIQPTVPATPGNSYRPPVSQDPSYSSASTSSSKLPLIIGIGFTAALVTGVAIAFRQSQFGGGGVFDNPLGNSQKSCTVVAESLNIRPGPGTDRDPLNTVQQGTKVLLTGTERNGWVEISSPVKGWVFGESQYINCATASQTPVPTPSQTVPPKKPDIASPDRGSSILKKANQKYQAGDLESAIALLKSIPLNSSTFQDAQATVKRWRQEWTNAEDKFNAAQKAFNEGRWQDVLALEKDTEFPDIQFWKDKLHDLVVKAEKRQAEEKPDPTTSPSPTTPTTSPSPTTSPTTSPSPTTTPTTPPEPSKKSSL
ncbi:MAG TPA: protein kinase [Candidatus Obscuribacterales bacterium]